MKILVIGGGGREHVLCWKLKQSSLVEKIFCIPGNAGISDLAECVKGDSEDLEFLADFAIKENVDLTVVGPEAPLVKGIVNYFENKGLLILGPEKEAALLEGSKVWAKEFMLECGIPTAPFKIFTDINHAVVYVREKKCPLVVKADGLAAGKGVYVTSNAEEAETALFQIMKERIFGEAGNKVIVEEKLSGEEASLLALTDGDKFWTMPSAQDHKAVNDGDTGPNTGGMGAYSPAPVMNDANIKYAEDKVFRPLIKGMKRRGLKYRGIIYAGLMMTDMGPSVLEFNVRFGDPEAQVILPRLDVDLGEVLFNTARGKLQGTWDIKKEVAVCVVMASGGYPGDYENNKIIKGLQDVSRLPETFVFHAGTALNGNQVVTEGGRVLGVTCMKNNIQEAVKSVYSAINKISFEGSFYRNDIAHRALNRN